MTAGFPVLELTEGIFSWRWHSRVSEASPSPELALINLRLPKDWARIARWHKSYPTKDIPVEDTRESFMDPASEEETSRIGVFLWPRKDMTGFTFPAKGNKYSTVPFHTTGNLPLYLPVLCVWALEFRPAEEWVLKRTKLLSKPSSCPPMRNLFIRRLSSATLLSKVKDWISATSKPPNPNIWCLRPVLPYKKL